MAIGQKFAVFFLRPEKTHTSLLFFSSRQFGQIRPSFVLSLLVSLEEEIVAEHAGKSTRVVEKLLGTTTPRGSV